MAMTECGDVADLKALASKVTALEAALRNARTALEIYADCGMSAMGGCESIARKWLDDNKEGEK